MLGKGLESLIPPQNSDDDSPQPSGRAEAIHPHLAPQPSDDPEPQILSFDFGDHPDESVQEPAPPPLPTVAPTPVGAKAGSPNAASLGPPPAAAAAQAAMAGKQDYIYHIEVEKIRPNPNQPRRNFNEDGLWGLAKSIREFGFLQPLVVSRADKETESGVDVEYQLIAGERRLLAAKKLGLTVVPAIIRKVDLERESLELSIVENVQREDLNPIERARAFQRLQEEFRLTQREIAAKLGKSRETVANTVRLLDLPLYIQEVLEKGQITESHGRFLLQIGDPAAQKKLFEDIVTNRLTTREVKHRVQTSKPRQEHGGREVSPELKMLEEKLTTELGTPVKIERGANTGKITITFYSDEELQSIIERFGVADET